MMRFSLLLFGSTASKVIWSTPRFCRCSGWSPSMKRCFSSSTEAQSVPLEPEPVTDNLEVTKNKKKEIPCPENARFLKVAIIGLPNAGKSTLINTLTNYDVCPVSSRPHTTRKNQQAVYLDNETQLVFVDTPGLVGIKDIKKFSFTDEFVYGPEKSIGRADLIAVIHDVSNKITRDKLDFRLKAVLQKFPDKRSILIMNKIDQISRKFTLLECMKYLTSGYVGGKLLPMMNPQENKKKQSHLPLDTEAILSNAKKRTLGQSLSVQEKEAIALESFFTQKEIKKGLHEQGWPNFHDVFMISALENDGIDLLRKYMIMNAPPHPWLFESDTLTNVPPMELTIRIMKAKLLDYLPQEMPFRVHPSIEFWDENDKGELCIIIRLKCEKERYKWRIMGTNNTLINRLTLETQQSLSSILYRPVQLKINPVSVEKPKPPK